MEIKYVYRELPAVVEVDYRYFYGDSDRNEVGRILERHEGYSGTGIRMAQTNLI